MGVATSGKCACCGADSATPLCVDCYAIAKTCPCRGCTQRYDSCHGSCERYLLYRKVTRVIGELRIKQRKNLIT